MYILVAEYKEESNISIGASFSALNIYEENHEFESMAQYEVNSFASILNDNA